MDHAALLVAMRDIALAAGDKIMEIYGTDFDTERKSDGSPVTEADEAADALIFEALSKIVPDIPIITEERQVAGIRTELSDHFILVDPLDGTKEFIKRNGEFTVNIALIENGSPILGVVHAPVKNRMFSGQVGSGAFEGLGEDRQEIQVRLPADDGWVAVGSRSHASAEDSSALSGITVKDTRAAGSSLKFCLVAAAEADIYPRMAPTMEWDTAAGDAVLRAAGGAVVNADGSPFVYGKSSGLLNPHFIAYGGQRPPALGT